MSRRKTAGEQLSTQSGAELEEPDIIVVDADTDGTEGVTQDFEVEHETHEDPGTGNAQEDWKAQYEAAKEERDAARREADDARRRHQDLEAQTRDTGTELINARKSAIESDITAATAKADAIQRELSAAYTEADSDLIAKKQRELARQEAQIMRLEEARDAIPAQAERRETRPEPISDDPIERELSQFSTKTASFLRENRDILTDPKKGLKAKSAHFDAVAEGIPLDTEQYFNFVKERVYGRPSVAEPKDETRQLAAPKKKPVPAAPPGRPSTSTSGKGSIEVPLTQTEQQTAIEMFSHLPAKEAVVKYAAHRKSLADNARTGKGPTLSAVKYRNQIN
jgi:hypothetical protein